ncbi:hypothetical protein FRB98_004288 [Tulasnella sp. 332]|nr:hypothetical protein FRB98_004288 [Tulasnella sp. 332]
MKRDNKPLSQPQQATVNAKDNAPIEAPTDSILERVSSSVLNARSPRRPGVSLSRPRSMNDAPARSDSPNLALFGAPPLASISSSSSSSSSSFPMPTTQSHTPIGMPKSTSSTQLPSRPLDRFMASNSSQVPDYLQRFSEELAGEVRSLVEEVGQLRDEKRSLQ